MKSLLKVIVETKDGEKREIEITLNKESEKETDKGFCADIEEAIIQAIFGQICVDLVYSKTSIKNVKSIYFEEVKR